MTVMMTETDSKINDQPTYTVFIVHRLWLSVWPSCKMRPKLFHSSLIFKQTWFRVLN